MTCVYYYDPKGQNGPQQSNMFEEPSSSPMNNNDVHYDDDTKHYLNYNMIVIILSGVIFNLGDVEC